MPIVTIDLTREGNLPGENAPTPAEKAALIRGVSEVLRDVLNKPLESTYVIVYEVELDNWGWGDMPTQGYRQLLAQRAAEEPEPPRSW